nr:hypothetical protein [uncultured Rhodopila sp.]
MTIPRPLHVGWRAALADPVWLRDNPAIEGEADNVPHQQAGATGNGRLA